MATVIEYPTMEQLHLGFDIDCEGSADPDLRLMAARRVKLQLVELPGDSSLSRDRWMRGIWEEIARNCGEGKPAAGPEREREPARKFDIEVLALAPGREHWTRCGSWAHGLRLCWREIDQALLTAFVARVIVALGLEERMGCGS